MIIDCAKFKRYLLNVIRGRDSIYLHFSKDGVSTIYNKKNHIFSTDTDMSITIPIETGVEGIIDAVDFYAQIKILKKGDIELIVDEENKGISIKKDGNFYGYFSFMYIDKDIVITDTSTANIQWEDIEPTVDLMAAISFAYIKDQNKFTNTRYAGMYIGDNKIYNTDGKTCTSIDLKQSFTPFRLKNNQIKKLMSIKDTISGIAVEHTRKEVGTNMFVEAKYIYFRMTQGLVVSMRERDTVKDYKKESVERLIESYQYKDEPVFYLPTEEFIPALELLASKISKKSIRKVCLVFFRDFLGIKETDHKKCAIKIPWPVPLTSSMIVDRVFFNADYLLNFLKKGFEGTERYTTHNIKFYIKGNTVKDDSLRPIVFFSDDMKTIIANIHDMAAEVAAKAKRNKN